MKTFYKLSVLMEDDEPIEIGICTSEEVVNELARQIDLVSPGLECIVENVDLITSHEEAADVLADLMDALMEKNGFYEIEDEIEETIEIDTKSRNIKRADYTLLDDALSKLKGIMDQ